MQAQMPHSQASQVYQTPSLVSGQLYQSPGQTYPASSQVTYQPPPSPGQVPFQSAGPVFPTPGQAIDQAGYQLPGQPSRHPYHGQSHSPQVEKLYRMDNLQNTGPMLATGANIPQQVPPGHLTASGQQPQHAMPSSVPQSCGMPPSNQLLQQYPGYQNSYSYSSPSGPNMPGSRPAADNQSYQTSPAAILQAYNQQTTDGRPPSYTPFVPHQPSQWVPPFANPAPSGHVTGTYQYGTQQVSYPPEQSSNRQPHSQNLPSSYPSGSYPSSSGYPVPGQQQAVSLSRQPYGQPPSQVYGPTYHQPGLTEPRTQYILRRSVSSDAKISSIDVLLCRAEELEPRVLSFSGRRGMLDLMNEIQVFRTIYISVDISFTQWT